MRIPSREAGATSPEDHAFVENQIDEMLERLYEMADGDEERFGEMLAHFVAISVAPSLAATNKVLRLGYGNSIPAEEQVRLSIDGEAHYVDTVANLEDELAEAVTNAVLRTLLGPSPRIPSNPPSTSGEPLFLN